MTLSDGWLYYISSSGINKMKPDGSEKTLILKCDCNRIALADHYIFYTLYVPEARELNSRPGADDGPRYIGELHRIGLDGKGDVKVVVKMITELSVYENNVYYSEGNNLYAMNPETLEKSTVYDGHYIEHLYFGDGYAFFILDRNLYKMSLAEGALTQLTKVFRNRCLGVLDGYVYGATDDPDAFYDFYRIRIDGVEMEKVV